MMHLRFLLVAVLFSSQVTQAQTPNRVEVIEKLEYSRPNNQPLLLDVIRPKSSVAPTPVILFVHGGGWKNGSRKSGHKNAAWLAERGFAVVTIDYRLTDVAQWPAQINDCYEAVRWIRRNAAQYNFDGDRIAAWGTSAGGHLVALLGTRPYPEAEDVSSRVQAVCDWFGPSDLLTMPPNMVANGRTEADVAKSNGAKLLGVTVKDDLALANDASGLHHVTNDDPPFLIMHGSEDPGVPLDQSQRLNNSLSKQGVASQLYIVEGAGHGGKLFQSAESRDVVRAFFTKHLKHHWAQAGGPAGNYVVDAPGGSKPIHWDYKTGQGVRWKKTLPETGQSTVVVWGDRLFFTTMKSVDQNSELASDVVAWCCDANTGATLWTQDIPAKHPLRLSGCFSDSSAVPAVTDGKHVCFFNASGRISCFDFHGKQVWTSESMPVGRTQPFIVDGNVIFVRQKYMPVDGHFTHEHKDAAEDMWTNLQALNLATGDEMWSSTCGVNMGCVPMPVKLHDGTVGILVGRGGGHSPPEKPDGVSLVSASDGRTLWSLPLAGFMSTQTYPVHNGSALVFHRDQHLWVSLETGQVMQRVSILEDVPVLNRNSEVVVETLKSSGKRNIIQQSNLLVNGAHYFRAYQRPYIGRVDLETRNVSYLQVPVQTRFKDGGIESLWDEADLKTPLPKSKKDRPFNAGTRISYVAFELNDVKNSRGHVVMGDVRSQANGWGHHASAIPSAINGRVYFPIMSGMVYSLNADAESFQEADVQILSLGPINKTWTRSSLSYGNGCIYARTIKELICIDGGS
ncbi:MAG: alpha/beta hydrolase fold domain-containing protein [Fuerstiella sp.]